MKDTTFSISLPSLIHRIGRDQVRHVQQQAKPLGCQLKRIRRSRNWQLIGQLEAMLELLIQLKQQPQQELSYLINKLTEAVEQLDQRQPKQQRLSALIRQHPNITVANLAELANCSLSEARAARFVEQEL